MYSDLHKKNYIVKHILALCLGTHYVNYQHFAKKFNVGSWVDVDPPVPILFTPSARDSSVSQSSALALLCDFITRTAGD